MTRQSQSLGSLTSEICRLSLNAPSQLVVYCYSSNLHLSYKANYSVLNITYERSTSSFEFTVYELAINLGESVIVEQISPLYMSSSCYQFLKYNYKSTPE